jgi:hypothetical protein
MDIEPAPEPDNTNQLVLLCDRLLASESDEVRLNTLNALDQIAHNHTLKHGEIANTVLAHLTCYSECIEVVAALRVLSICVHSYASQYLGDIISKIGFLISCGEEDILDVLCPFLRRIFSDDHAIFLFGKNTLPFLINAAHNAPFERRVSTITVLLQVVDECSDEQIRKVVELDIVPCLIDFLDTDSGPQDFRITCALSRILNLIIVNGGDPAAFLEARDMFAQMIEERTPEVAEIAQTIVQSLDSLPGFEMIE